MKKTSLNLELIEAGIWKNHTLGNYLVKVSEMVKGKRKQLQGSAKNLQQAKIAKKALTNKLAVLIKESQEKTIGEFEDEFMIYLQTTVSQATFYRQQGIYRDQIFLPWKNLRFSELDTRAFEKLYQQQVLSKSVQTQRHFLTFLRKLNKRAVQCGYMNNLVANIITAPKRKKKNLSALDSNEIIKLLNFLKSNHQLIYFHAAIAVYTGTRAGELRAIKWKDVDYEKNLISINKTLSRKHGEKPHTKNGESRIIPINKALKIVLEDLKTQTFDSPDSLILPYWREFWSDEQAKALRMMCVAAGVKEIRWHDLRSSFITELLVNGVSMDKVMNVVGHKLISTVQEYYRILGRGIENATECLNFEIENHSE